MLTTSTTDITVYLVCYEKLKYDVMQFYPQFNTEIKPVRDQEHIYIKYLTSKLLLPGTLNSITGTLSSIFAINGSLKFHLISNVSLPYHGKHKHRPLNTNGYEVI